MKSAEGIILPLVSSHIICSARMSIKNQTQASLGSHLHHKPSGGGQGYLGGSHGYCLPNTRREGPPTRSEALRGAMLCEEKTNFTTPTKSKRFSFYSYVLFLSVRQVQKLKSQMSNSALHKKATIPQ